MPSRLDLAASALVGILLLSGCSFAPSPEETPVSPRCVELLDAFDRASAFAVDYEENPSPAQTRTLDGIVAELEEKGAGATGELASAIARYAAVVDDIKAAAADDSVPGVSDDAYDQAVSDLYDAGCAADE